MTETNNRLVQKLWSDCQILRDDGLSYRDSLEHLTSLLFLNLAEEIADDLRSALEQIESVLGDLPSRGTKRPGSKP